MLKKYMNSRMVAVCNINPVTASSLSYSIEDLRDKKDDDKEDYHLVYCLNEPIVHIAQTRKTDDWGNQWE